MSISSHRSLDATIEQTTPFVDQYDRFEKEKEILTLFLYRAEAFEAMGQTNAAISLYQQILEFRLLVLELLSLFFFFF